MRKQIQIKFSFGEVVSLKTDPSVRRVITGIVLRPSGKMYELAYGIETTWHHDVEIERFPANDNIKVCKGFKR